VLRRPELDHFKTSVLPSLGSVASKRTYAFAINEFIASYCSEHRLAFGRTVVNRYALVTDIEAESRVRKVLKSDVIRERLEEGRQRGGRKAASWEAVADVVGSVSGLPADLSRRKKAYLGETGYGQKRHR
jgi:hypothetical protein